MNLIDPLLGELTYDSFHGYRSKKMPVAFLRGHQCSFAFGNDPRPEEIRAAIKNVLDAKLEILVAAEPHVLQYREDVLAFLRTSNLGPKTTPEAPADIWAHVTFGDEFQVERNEEAAIDVSLQCACDWEPEHGLELVLRNGLSITKVGPFGQHAEGDVVYAPHSTLGCEEIGHVVLGKGPEGTFGYVGLRLFKTGSGVAVEWAAGVEVPLDVQSRVMNFAEQYLADYLNERDFGLRAVILTVLTDPVRRNDYERAVWLAIHGAIVRLGLPVPLLYAPPDEAD